MLPVLLALANFAGAGTNSLVGVIPASTSF
jgi:hypothetical protein